MVINNSGVVCILDGGHNSQMGTRRGQTDGHAGARWLEAVGKETGVLKWWLEIVGVAQ